MGWLDWMQSSNSRDLMSLHSAISLFHMRKSSNNQSLLELSGKMQRWAQFFFLYPCPLQDDFVVPPTKRSIPCIYLDWSCDLQWLRKWLKRSCLFQAKDLHTTALFWNPAITMWTSPDKPARRWEATWNRDELAGVIQTSQPPANPPANVRHICEPKTEQKNHSAESSPNCWPTESGMK